VEAVANGTLPADMQRRIGFPWSPMMVERSRRSVGATLAAARDVVGCGAGLSGPPLGAPERGAPRPFAIAANLAGGRHHAFRDRGEGFCVFNDVAVTAAVLLGEAAIARAAVVDCDVHQGNGTAAIFRDEPAVFTCSLHGENNFPFRKELSDLDVTFADGAGDDEYLEALGTHLPHVLDRHGPDIVFYLAGADPYEGDRLGRLSLTIDGLRTRDRLVFEACRRRGIPVVVTMSGGYAPDVEAIVTIHCNTIREAVGAARRVPGAGCRVPGAVQSAAVLDAVQGAAVLDAVQGAAVLDAVQGAAVLDAVQGAAVLDAVQGAAVLDAVQGAAVLGTEV
jgi:acetoin utilization deacetylase AcuC-like enzyme